LVNKLAEPLNADAIGHALVHPALLASLEVLATVDSTNLYLQGLSPSNQGHFCITETQTHGKGRRGNLWHSEGHNLSFSLRWHFASTPPNLSGLGIVTSLVCAQALSSLGYAGIMVKWPNDLIAHDKKLGGILVEHFMQNNASNVIIGIGINGIGTQNKHSDLGSIELNTLAPEHQQQNRNIIVSTILNQLLPVLDTYETKTILQDTWDQFDWTKDQAVYLLAGNKKTSGIARGIESDGALRLETAERIQHFHSGDVSLRKS